MPRVSIINIIFSYLTNKKPFRISKNGQPTNIFKKISDEKDSHIDERIEFEDGEDAKNVNKINVKRSKTSKKKSKNIVGSDEDPK